MEEVFAADLEKDLEITSDTKDEKAAKQSGNPDEDPQKSIANVSPHLPPASTSEVLEHTSDTKSIPTKNTDIIPSSVPPLIVKDETLGNPNSLILQEEAGGQRSRSSSTKSGASGSLQRGPVSDVKAVLGATPPGSPVTPESTDHAPPFDRQGTPDVEGKTRPYTGSKADRSRRRPIEHPGSPQTIVSERQQLALLKQQAKSEKQQSPDPVSRERPGTPSGSSTSSKDGKETRIRRDPKGETPLHVACRKGDMPSIRKLLEEGADINASDYAGWTPMHEAANHGREDVIKVLYKNGANIHAKGGAKSITPLMDAVINGHQNIVKFLLRVGSDSKATDSDGKTCFQLTDRNEEILTVLKNFESGEKSGGTFSGTAYTKRSRDEEARKPGSDEMKSSSKAVVAAKSPSALGPDDCHSHISGSSTIKDSHTPLSDPKPDCAKSSEGVEISPAVNVSTGTITVTDPAPPKPSVSVTASQGSQYEDISDDEEPESPTPMTVSPAHPAAASPRPAPVPNPSRPIALTLAGQPWNPPSAVFVSNSAPLSAPPLSSASPLASSISAPVPFPVSPPLLAATARVIPAPVMGVIPSETPQGIVSHTSVPQTKESSVPLALPNQTKPVAPVTPPQDNTDFKVETAKPIPAEELPPTKEASAVPPTDTVMPTVPALNSIPSANEDKPVISAATALVMVPASTTTVTTASEVEAIIKRDLPIPISSVSAPMVESKLTTTPLTPVTVSSVVTVSSPVSIPPVPKPAVCLPQEPPTNASFTVPVETLTTAVAASQPPTTPVPPQPSLVIRPVSPAKPQSLSLAVRVPLTLGIPPALPIPAISLSAPGILPVSSKSETKGSEKSKVMIEKKSPDKDKANQMKSPFGVSSDRIMLSLKKPPPRSSAEITAKVEVGPTAVATAMEGEVGKSRGVGVEDTSVPTSSKKKEELGRKPMTRQRAQAQVVGTASQTGTHKKKSPKEEKPLRGRTKRALSAVPPLPDLPMRDPAQVSEEPRQKKPRGGLAKKLKNVREEPIPPKLMIEPTQEYIAESSVRLPLKKRFTIRNEIEEFVTQRRLVEENWKNYTNNFPMKAFPKNCSDYLIMRKNYSVDAQLSKKLEPPLGLPPELKTFFVQQEEERQNLMRQHIVERDRLIMGAEQEMMRLHQRFCRIQAGITIPYSACMIMSEQESNRSFQNQEQDDRTRSATRNRITMRDLIKWLEESDDKFDYAKKEMLTRHRLEARMLRSKQRLDWMWKLDDLGMSDPSCTRNPEERDNPYVSEVAVEDFVMLPDQ